MADNQSHPPPPPSPDAADPAQYWCYHCDKRVSVETLPNHPDVICFDCKNGFVELISVPPPSLPSDTFDDPALGSQFLRVLRLIAQSAREDHAPGDRQREEAFEEEEDGGNSSPPPPPDHHSENDDFLRIELDGWHDQEEGDEENPDDDVEDEEEEEEEEEDDEGEDEENARRRRRDVLRVRIRDIARAASGRNRILDLSEILLGLNNSIEFRVEMTDPDGYVGNPEDYLDAAGYEALLQNLAETDSQSRRGPPPAAKSVIANLPTVTINNNDPKNSADTMSVGCAICKDSMNVGETVKRLPCGHDYHEDCIVPWLGSRNTCPVCRYELPTDDAEYEEERKQKTKMIGGAGSGGASGSTV